MRADMTLLGRLIEWLSRRKPTSDDCARPIRKSSNQGDWQSALPLAPPRVGRRSQQRLLRAREDSGLELVADRAIGEFEQRAIALRPVLLRPFLAREADPALAV